MYCVILFWLLDMYVYIYSRPATCMSSTGKGGSYILLAYLCSYLPAIRSATLWWKPHSILSMWGVTTQVFMTKSNTEFTMAKYKRTGVRAYATYCPSIFNKWAQLCLSFWIFLRTDRQWSSIVVSIGPMYQKDLAVSRDWSCALKEFSAPTCASSSTNFSCFFSTTLAQRELLVWRWLSYSHGTNMS